MCVYLYLFQKCSYIVNHSYLIKKLVIYKTHYLSDRYQVILYNDVLSDIAKINCGISQGIIFGYINDLINAFTLFKFTMFADDTTLFIEYN